MKKYNKIVSSISLLMSLYFFYVRFDVINRFLKRDVLDLGELLLPIILLIISIILFISPTIKKNESKNSN